MGEVGDDLKEAFQDVGSSLTVLRDSGDVTGEYGMLAMNRQVTKPFIREFFRDTSLPYDTLIIAGDVVEENETGEVFLVVNMTPQILENEIIKYSANFYKCNVSGELRRPSEVDGGWDTNYHMAGGFSVVKARVYALQTEALFGHSLDLSEELGALGLEAHELYVSKSVGIQVLDRYEASSGEYSIVETVKHRQYNNIDVCKLTEDTR